MTFMDLSRQERVLKRVSFSLIMPLSLQKTTGLEMGQLFGIAVLQRKQLDVLRQQQSKELRKKMMRAGW